jgi:ankyrin repeat protein
MVDEGYPPGTIPASELEYCAVVGDLRGVVAALAAGSDVNARAADGYTALHGAAENGRLEIVRLLVERGADLAARADGGVTPLALAEAAGQLGAVALLLSLAANRAEPPYVPPTLNKNNESVHRAD